MTGRTRRRLALAGLSLLVLAALVGALEGALRLAGRGPPPLPSPFTDDAALGEQGSGAVPDRELFYRLRSDSQFLGYYRINALGCRGPQVATAREPRTLRVVCTGDSSTFGLGVPEDRAWPFVLGRLLDVALEDRLAVEIVDAGVPGYTTLQNRVQIERDLLPLRPDVLVWLPTGHNDDARVAGRDDAEALALRRSVRFTLARTAIGSALGLRVDGSTPADAGATVDAPSAGAGLRPRVPLADFEANLRAVADDCRAAGVPLLLLVPPHDAAVRAQRPDERAAEELVLRVARELDLPCSDPRADLDALAPRPLYPDTVHPNADGQAVLGWRAFEGLAAFAGDFPWWTTRASFAQAWVTAHRIGVSSPGFLEALLAADAPPRFRALVAALRGGPDAATVSDLVFDPVSGERRGPYELGRELLAHASGDASAASDARLEELRANVAPRDDLALLLFEPTSGDAPQGAPSPDAVVAARAVAALDAALGAHPAPQDRRLFEAQARADAGDAPAAQALLDQVLALDPRCAEACAVRGQLLERAGDKAGALAAFEQGAQLEPGSATGLFLLGRAQLQRGDAAGAETSLRQALQLDPAHKLARLALVHALIRLQQPDAAAEQLRALRRLGATAVADVAALQAAIDALRSPPPRSP